MTLLARRDAIPVFLAFAFAYFFSALVRAITATLSPTLTVEFALNARDLGLLAGGYFLGFAATQLPLGTWLDRHGPKKVILYFLGVAVAGCAAFSMATSFSGLLAARVLCGVGVSACLMAPLTGYRRWFDATAQIRANSWMLMTGSLGMVASTLPVQWLMPYLGWRPLFWGLAGLIMLSMAVITWRVPRWENPPQEPSQPASAGSYAAIWKHPYFRKMVPIGFFSYGGLLAMQTLWAGPWMVKVAGYTPLQAAAGLFWINVSMLCTFWTWGLVNPWLVRRGLHADRLIARGLPLSFAVLAIIVIAAEALGRWTTAAFSLFCMASTFVSLTQPAVGMAFPPALAGRALSAYNLVIFAGVFVVQWGIGLLIDLFRAMGWEQVAAFQGAWTIFLACCMASYVYFVAARPDNQKQ
ncbi:MAG TPA: MFS transporter [Burkholderiaceae bacterium]|nr:MFS transporter [Burkholderiaceae bacterium]